MTPSIIVLLALYKILTFNDCDSNDDVRSGDVERRNVSAGSDVRHVALEPGTIPDEL